LIFRTGLRLHGGIALALALAACGGSAPFGTVELGDLVVEGEVDGDYLYRQLRQLDPPFEACYMHAKSIRSSDGRLRHMMVYDGYGGILIRFSKILNTGLTP